MAELVALTFPQGAPRVTPQDAAAVVGGDGLATVTPPDVDRGLGALPGAVELGVGDRVAIMAPTGLPTGALALELVLMPEVPAPNPAHDVDAAVGTIVGAGPVAVTTTPREGGLGLVVAASTSTGDVLFPIEERVLAGATWQRLTVAFTGTELAVFNDDQLVARLVLPAPVALVPATTIALGAGGDLDVGAAPQSTHPMAVAGLRVLDGLPDDLQQVLDVARARGDDELASLAATRPDLAVDIDQSDSLLGPSRHRSSASAEFVWHAVTGAHVLTGPIRDLWLGREAWRGQLGYPFTDVVPAATFFAPWRRGASPTPPLARVPSAPSGSVVQFEGGVVMDVAGTAIPVTGQILVRWREHGGAAGFLGAPLGVALDGGPNGPAVDGADPPTHGLRQDFEGGTIWWHRSTGAHVVFGPMLAAYEGRGGPAVAGYPTCEQVAPDEDAPGLSLPCTASILRLPDGTAPGHLLSIAVHRTWEAAAASLGEVRGDEVVRGSGTRVLSCARGVVVALPGDEPRAVTTLEVTLLSAMVPEADDGIELFGWDDTAELMVKSTVTIDNAGDATGVSGVVAVRAGDDSRRVDLAVPSLVIPRVQQDTTIRITCEAFDHDTWSADDRLGGLDVVWDVDTMWGMREQGAGAREVRGEGGDGTVIYAYRISSPGIDPGSVPRADFREHLWWRFDNFSTPSLGRDLFTETFEDVEARADASFADLLVEAYYEFYEGSAAGGNCYGMALEAVRTNLGIGLWRAPLDDVGPSFQVVEESDLDPWIARRFNRNQGTQLSGAMVLHVVTSMVNGAILRPRTVFDEVRARTAAGEAVILSMYSIATGTGHAVVGYHTVTAADGTATIFVADPNTPWGPAVAERSGEKPKDWRDMSSSRIDVRPDGSWAFRHRGGVEHPTYRAAPGMATATLMVVPAGVALAPPRTPLGDLAQYLAWLTGALVLLNGGVTTSMSMGDQPPPAYASGVPALWGLRPFQDSEVGPGDGWMTPAQTVETYGDRLAATPGLLRLPVLDGGPAEAYARTGRFPDTFTHQVVADGGDDLLWQLHTSRHQFATRGQLHADASLALDLQGLEGPVPAITLAGVGARVDVALDYLPGRLDRGLPGISTALPVGTDVTSAFQLRDEGRRVTVVPGAPMHDLEVRLVTPGQPGPPAVVRLGTTAADVRLDLQPIDLVSPLGTQVVSRVAPDGGLLDHAIVAPIA